MCCRRPIRAATPSSPRPNEMSQSASSRRAVGARPGSFRSTIDDGRLRLDAARFSASRASCRAHAASRSGADSRAFHAMHCSPSSLTCASRRLMPGSFLSAKKASPSCNSPASQKLPTHRPRGQHVLRHLGHQLGPARLDEGPRRAPRPGVAHRRREEPRRVLRAHVLAERQRQRLVDELRRREEGERAQKRSRSSGDTAPACACDRSASAPRRRCAPRGR